MNAGRNLVALYGSLFFALILSGALDGLAETRAQAHYVRVRQREVPWFNPTWQTITFKPCKLHKEHPHRRARRRTCCKSQIGPTDLGKLRGLPSKTKAAIKKKLAKKVVDAKPKTNATVKVSGLITYEMPDNPRRRQRYRDLYGWTDADFDKFLRVGITGGAPVTRYWVGGGSSTNWDATAATNWSATSGGTNDASVPVSGDTVIIDGAGASGNSAVTVNVNLNGLASVSMNAGYTSTVTVTLTQTNNSGWGAVTIASGTLTASGGTQTIDASSLTMTGGTVSISTRSLFITNSASISGGTWTAGILRFQGSTAATLSCSISITTLTLVATGNRTVTLTSSVTVTGTSSSAGSAAGITNTFDLAGFTLTSATVSIGGGGTSHGKLLLSNGTVSCSASLTLNNTGGSSIDWSAGGTVSLTGTATATLAGTLTGPSSRFLSAAVLSGTGNSAVTINTGFAVSGFIYLKNVAATVASAQTANVNASAGLWIGGATALTVTGTLTFAHFTVFKYERVPQGTGVINLASSTQVLGTGQANSSIPQVGEIPMIRQLR